VIVHGFLSLKRKAKAMPQISQSGAMGLSYAHIVFI
jgi:hypothetical protein